MQYRCFGWSPCQSAGGRRVQACEPATGVIVIDISTLPDRADAINNPSGLIKLKRQLGQVVEIAVWMRAEHECNLCFGEPDFGCRFHRRAHLRNSLRTLLSRFAP